MGKRDVIFPIQKLPEELVDMIFLSFQNLETYKKLTTIRFFDRYFDKHKFFIAHKYKRYDKPYYESQMNRSKEYTFGDQENGLPRFKLTSSVSNDDIYFFKSFKFCILRIQACIDDGASIERFCNFLKVLKINYFVEIEVMCSCLRTRFQYGDWKLLFMSPYLKGITFRPPEEIKDFDLLQLKVLKSFDLLTPDHDDFVIHPDLSLRRLVLRFEGEKVPKFITSGFQNIPLVLLNISLRNELPLEIIRKFSLTIKKLIILHLTDSNYDFVIDNMQFPSLEHIYLESVNPRSISFKNSNFPVLNQLAIKTLPNKPDLLVQRCSFDKLISFSIPNAGFSKLRFIRNHFPNLQCLPVESDGYQSISFESNKWPLVNKTRDEINAVRNELKRRNSDESDWF